MRRNGDIAFRVRAAKGDARAADALVRDYLPFIKSQAAEFAGRPLAEGRDDELAVAMFAFHEAVLSYDDARGAFIPFAVRAIRHRLIDFARRERRHGAVDSLDVAAFAAGPDGDGAESSLTDSIVDQHDDIAERELREASRDEIAHFAEQLAEFGLSLPEVAKDSPRQQRTLDACRRALACARTTPGLLESFARAKRLPMASLAEGAGVERKTLERHRRYLVALLLAYTNGFEIIRGHLCKIVGATGGAAQ